jgi:phosphoribosylanthranilate isomerase
MSETHPRATGSPPRVKICGITDLHDAELAVELGAWAIGMVFYDGSPRRCSTEQALRITTALRRRVELCGVFVGAPLEQLARLTEELGLSMLQLHGDEGPAFCAEARRRTGARVIKAIQLAGAGDVRELERYHVDFHLADARARALAKQDLRGGTGETFDWSLLAARHSPIPLILSGGLHPGNVAAAAERVRPYAVDTASGTERAPGHKDEAKLRAFFDAVSSTAARTDPLASAAADVVVTLPGTPIEGSPA